jgi:uncharacterized protein YbaP (TraB family)
MRVMKRRDCLLGLATFGLAGVFKDLAAASQRDAGPHFLSITRGNARVFLLGFGEAKDDSWVTPQISQAFDKSSGLWLEVGHSDLSPGPEVQNRIEELSHEKGCTFFDVLKPPVRERTLAYMSELGIKRESVETLRPWRAYYVIMSAFYSTRRPSSMPVLPDEMFSKRAMATHKEVSYEMPTYLSFAEFMANMPDAAQSDYIAWLLDFLDDVKSGRVIDMDDAWTRGEFAAETRSLDRMRTRMPALYKIMQVGRNAWWARKIDELLGTGDTHFIAVGNLHAVGPDGIPAQVRRLNIASPVELSGEATRVSWAQ